MFEVEPVPPEIAPEDLIDETDSLASRLTREEARFAALAREIIETRAYERDGYSSPSAMLAHRYSMHPFAAQQLVQRAQALTKTPLVSLAYDRGAITTAQVDALLRGYFLAGDAFAEDEGVLVEMALDTPLVRDLNKQVEYWLQQVAPDDQAADRMVVKDLRGVTIRRDLEMIRATMWFDLETGEQVLAALDPGPPTTEDDRSIAARRADHFLDIINGATERPNLTVHVSAETLIGQSSATSETGRGAYLTTDEVLRIGCDATVTGVLFGSGRRPLDVGRTKRLVTPVIRIALDARDLRCVFPSCDRPANWCDAHHIVHWAAGGATDLDNLCLLCRHHHTLVHEAKWTIEGEPGNFQFNRPDGTRLGADPPPIRRVRPGPKPLPPIPDIRAMLAVLPKMPEWGPSP